MPIRYLASCLLLFSLCSSLCYAKNPLQIPFVVSGVISESSSALPVQQFIKYLRQKTGLNLKIYYADNYMKLSSIMRQQPLSIGWTCGAPFVEDATQDQQQLVSVPLLNQQPLYHSLIISQRDRPEKKLSDFKNKIFAYSDPRSNSGYLAPGILLKNQNINIRQHFSLMINTGSHENSIIALRNKLVDVAAIDEYVWQEYAKKHPDILQQLHEIERLGPFPFTPIVAGKDVNAQTIRQLRQVLVNMTNDPWGKRILLSLGMDGFVNKPAEFYQPIREMLNTLNTENQPQ